jgi:hypothetical protein
MLFFVCCLYTVYSLFDMSDARSGIVNSVLLFLIKYLNLKQINV